VDLAKYAVTAVLIEGRSVRRRRLDRTLEIVGQRHVALYREGGEAALVTLKRGPVIAANPAPSQEGQYGTGRSQSVSAAVRR
jgi:hypothetical protein